MAKHHGNIIAVSYLLFADDGDGADVLDLILYSRVGDRFVIYWQNNDLLHPKTMIYNVKDRNSTDSHYKISTA